MKKIRINQGRIVPPGIRFAGTVILMTSMTLTLMFLPEIPAIILFIIGSLAISALWSSYRLLEIYPKTDHLSEIVLIAGFSRKRKNAGQRVVKIEQEKIPDWEGKGYPRFVAYLLTDQEQKFMIAGAYAPDLLKKKISPVLTRLNHIPVADRIPPTDARP